jgi:hypothetical protein
LKRRLLFLFPALLVACVAPVSAAVSQPPVSHPAVNATHQGDERPSSDQKLWALGMAALLIGSNGGDVDLLGGSEKTRDSGQDSRERMENGWGITSRDDLLKTLNWLALKGHRELFNELISLPSSQLSRYGNSGDAESRNKMDIVLQYGNELGNKGIAAWDFGRYVALCGWGYQAGYLTEAEAWQMIMPIARRTQPVFHSWKDFGNDYLVGRRFWSLAETNASGQRFEQEYQYLLVSGKNPWSRVPWDLDLSQKAAGK